MEICLIIVAGVILLLALGIIGVILIKFWGLRRPEDFDNEMLEAKETIQDITFRSEKKLKEANALKEIWKKNFEEQKAETEAAIKDMALALNRIETLEKELKEMADLKPVRRKKKAGN